MSSLKKGVKILSNIITVILLLILAVIIYGRLSIMFTNNSYPNYFGYTMFEVSSGSMEPALSVNDIVVVKIGNDNLVKDDIITYINDKNEIITHRIVIVNSDTITVMGDANNTYDTPINRDQVVGKVIKIYPELGVWQKVITEPKILIVLFITLLAFDFAISYDGKEKEVKKTKSKKVKKEKKENIPEKVVEKEEKTVKVNDPIDVNVLLDYTSKIDLEEINKTYNDKRIHLNKSEMRGLKKKIDSIDENKPVLPKLEQKEKDFIEYTIRLDLKAIQNKFKNKKSK